MYDVIVVGAGPCGSRTAYRLANLGYHVIVLEKHLAIGQKSCCTGIVSQECIDRFAIPEDLIVRHFHSARIVAPSGVSVRLSRPRNQAAVIDRHGLDCYLSDITKARGVQYYLRRKVEYISLRPEKAVVGIKDEGCDYQLEARAVVLATGFSSVLVKDLDLGHPSYVAAGAQTEVRLNGANEVEVYFGRKTAPGFFAWLVPTSGGKGLAGLISHFRSGYYLRRWLEKLKSQEKILPDTYQMKYGGIPLRTIAKTFRDRVVAVGDAAGQVKPTTGGGIYFGLLCAEMAAETLHDAFQSGDLSAASLSRYEISWREKLGTELRREYFARRMFERLSDGQIEKLITVSASSGLIESLLQDSSVSFDWHGGIIKKVVASGLKKMLRPITG